MRIVAGFAIGALFLGLPGTSIAETKDIYAQYFSGADGGKPCYARIYDDAHLKAHPMQTVRRLEIDFDKTFGDTDRPNSASYFEIGISFMLRLSKKWNGDSAYCKTAKGYFDCYLVADDGLIHLTPQGGALCLTVINRGGVDAKSDQIRLEGEGDEDSVGFGAPNSDDLVFDLPHADRKFCDAAGKE
jgi:hypothetical protein